MATSTSRVSWWRSTGFRAQPPGALGLQGCPSRGNLPPAAVDCPEATLASTGGIPMLSTADNELLTRTNAGTPMGELFRRFWLPALLPSELPEPDCPPIRIRLLGEDLV